MNFIIDKVNFNNVREINNMFTILIQDERSIYGKIVSAADRNISVEDIIELASNSENFFEKT